MKAVTRRLFFAELLERAFESGMGLLGHRFRTVEELDELPLTVVLEIVPARCRSSPWQQVGSTLWQVGEGDPPRRTMDLSAAGEAILAACDRRQRLRELVPTVPEVEGEVEAGEALRVTFIQLVRAGVVVPAELPSS